jgi:hypothetical protein
MLLWHGRMIVIPMRSSGKNTTGFLWSDRFAVNKK